MKRFSEQLKAKAKTVTLTAAERADLEARVISYMEYHPRVAKPTTKVSPLGVTMPQFSLSQSHTLFPVSLSSFLRYGVASFSVLVLVVSYVAESAVPGDSLYAIKVEINEEVRASFARTPYEKVVWETERLNRRLAEARLLAETGQLTAETEEQVVAAVKEHSANARREIAVLQEVDEEEATLARVQFATALDVQAQTVRPESDGMALSMRAMSADVDGVTMKEASVQQGVVEETRSSEAFLASIIEIAREEQAVVTEPEVVDTLPSYERLVARTEQETTRAIELLSSLQRTAAPSEVSDVQRRLDDIQRLIAEAMGKAGGDDVAARTELLSAFEQTQKLIVFMTNLDVREAVTVEEIVPVVLTRDERVANIVERSQAIMPMLITLRERLIASSTPVALEEKFLPIVTERQAEIGAIIASSTDPVLDVTYAEGVLLVAEAEVADIQNTLAADSVPPMIEDAGQGIEVPPDLDIIDTISTSTLSTSTTEEIIDPILTPVAEF